MRPLQCRERDGTVQGLWVLCWSLVCRLYYHTLLPCERQVWDDGGLDLTPSNQRREVRGIGEYVQTNKLGEESEEKVKRVSGFSRERKII